MLFSVTLSIGESIYSPKTYEYAMMVSPKGREGTYSALASAPLFTAKFFVGGLSGVLLGKYCTGIPAWPDPMSCEHGDTVWMIIGLVCITSPIGLYLFESCIRQPYINDDTGLEGTYNRFQRFHLFNRCFFGDFTVRACDIFRWWRGRQHSSSTERTEGVCSNFEGVNCCGTSQAVSPWVVNYASLSAVLLATG